jgi:cytochrome c-type biogenesis protein CcmH
VKYILTAERALWILLIIAVTFAPSTGAAAPERSPHDEDVLREARNIYNQIMSPYCPGQSLANCGSGAAEVLRAQIRDRLADGDSSEEIIASLVEEFGESVMAAPPNRGFARLAWIGPFAILLAGLVLVVVYLRRHTARLEKTDGQNEIDSVLRARVEDELKTHRN